MAMPLPEGAAWRPYASVPPTQGAIWPYASAPQGWQCPGCGHCYSPATSACGICPQQPVTATGANALPDPEITCAACRHTAPTMAEVAWQPDWKQWRCTDPAACHKRQQEAGMEDDLRAQG
jgi:hypothetical protein